MRKNAHGRISWWIHRARSIPRAPRFMAFCARSPRHRDGESDKRGVHDLVLRDARRAPRNEVYRGHPHGDEPRLRGVSNQRKAGAGEMMREIVFDTETTGLDPYQ